MNPNDRKKVIKKVIIGVDPASGPDMSAMAEKLSSGEITFRSVRNMEPAVLTLSPQPINLCFSDEGGMIGEFRWDRDKKRWTFEGNMDEAAKQFAKFMFAHFQSLIEGDRDGLLEDPVVPADFEEKLVESVRKPWPEMLVESNFDAKRDPGFFRKMYEGKF